MCSRPGAWGQIPRERDLIGLVALVLGALAIVYFNDSWRSLERARSFVPEICRRSGVQFLDGSVVQIGVSFSRADGGWTLSRRYRFEFASDGSRRLKGELSLRGGHFQLTSMEMPQGGVLLDAEPKVDGGDSGSDRV